LLLPLATNRFYRSQWLGGPPSVMLQLALPLLLPLLAGRPGQIRQMKRGRLRALYVPGPFLP